MILVGYARECRSRLTLATSTDNHHSLRWELVDIFSTNERTFGNVQVAKFHGHLNVVDHTASHQGNLTLIAYCGIYYLLHT